MLTKINIHWNILCLHLGLSSHHFLRDCSTKMMYALLASPIQATCSAHYNLLDLITLTRILG